MTTLVVFWIVANIIGVTVTLYATVDAWQEYRYALRTNGWRKLAARAMLRSHAVRLAEVSLLLTAALLAATWPAVPPLLENRPEWVLMSIRGALTGVVVLITVNAVGDVAAKRRILRRPAE